MKKILALVAAITLSMSSASYAADSASDVLTESFSSITTVAESATKMRSKTRTTITGGRFRAYVKTTKFSVFDFSPPSFSAGCGGISAHFGGLSFANGEEYKQLIETILQNSPGLLIQLAILTACEPCATALSWIQKVTEAARLAAVDSCKAAQFIVGHIAKTTKLCQGLSGLMSTQGRKTDGSDSETSCENSVKSWTEWDETNKLDAEGNTLTTETKKYCDSGGFKVWCALSAIQLTPSEAKNVDGIEKYVPRAFAGLNDSDKLQRAFAELLLYQLPTESTAKDPNAPESELIKTADAKAGGAIFEQAFKCGRSGGTAPSTLTGDLASLRDEVLKEECGNFWEVTLEQEISVLNEDSENDTGSLRISAPQFAKKKIKTWMSDRKFAEVGFYPRILDILLEASANAVARQNISSEALSLIQNTPLPLVQLLNLSYAYPLKAAQKLSSGADVIANIVVRTNLIDIIRLQTKGLVFSRIKKEDQITIRKGIANFVDGVLSNSNKKEADAVQKDIVNFVIASQTLLTQEISKSTLNNNILFHQKYLFEQKKPEVPVTP